MSHALDRAVAGVRVDRRPGENERVHLFGKARRDHRRGPAALAKPNEIDPAAEVVDGDDQFFEVVVDVEVLHVVGGGLPIGQRDVADAVGEQRLDQALAFVIVGDLCPVAREGRIDKSWNPPRAPVIAQSHGAQIEAHDIGRRQLRLEPAVYLDLFLDEIEVPECEIGLRFLDSRHQGDGPEEGKADRRRHQVGGSGGFGHDSLARSVRTPAVRS